MLTLILFAFICFASLVFMLRVAATGRKPQTGEPLPSRLEVRRSLVYGLFYCNPDDPRAWVPKLRGYGWTLNLRRPAWVKAAQVVLVGLLVSLIGCLITSR